MSFTKNENCLRESFRVVKSIHNSEDSLEKVCKLQKNYMCSIV